MEVLEVRQAIETSISGYLGTYTLPNGFVTPAISVRNTGDTLPAGYTVAGLEAIIIRTPALAVTNLYTDQIQEMTWTLYLVQWKGSNTINAAISKLQRDFPLASFQELSIPEGVGPREQCRFDIPAIGSPIANGGMVNSDASVAITVASVSPVNLTEVANQLLIVDSIVVEIVTPWDDADATLSITDDLSIKTYFADTDVDLTEIGEYEVFLAETLGEGRRLIAVLDSAAATSGQAKITINFADN